MPEKTIVLKGVTAWAEGNIHSAGFAMFKQNIEERSHGRIKIQYIGGPEVIPAFSQGDAVQNGLVDFSVISGAYYSNQVPEATVLNYSELTATEERENGSLNFMNEIHNQKLHAQLIGRASGVRCSLYLKQPVDSINGLKGKRFRATASYLPFLKALGAEAVLMPTEEIYASLEQNIIDGVAWPEVGITDLGLQKQVKYQVSPPYYQVDGVIIMNLDTWKQLARKDRDLIHQGARELEKDLPRHMGLSIAKEQKKLKAAGMKEIKFPEQEYVKMANDSAWRWVETNLLENGKKLRELFRKE